MLISQIKKDQVIARKDKNVIAANLLTTLIGEAEMVGKNNGNRAPTDAEVQVVIKKFIKGIDEIVGLTFDNKNIDTFLAELTILKSYLPQQMTDDELATEISKIVKSLESQNISAPRAIGEVMKQLSSNFAGKFDSKTASNFIKEMLAVKA